MVAVIPLCVMTRHHCNFGILMLSTEIPNHLEVDWCGHVLQIIAVASMGAIDPILYAPTAWCTSISVEWIVNQLNLTIISTSENNGGIRFMKEGLRIMMGFWYEGRK